MKLQLAALALLLSALHSLTAWADELRRNPFKAPAEFAIASSASGASATGARVVEMRVTGILIAEDTALVSIGGKVLEVGDEFNDHVLLQATEDQAIFLRGEEVVTMQLYSEENDEIDDL